MLSPDCCKRNRIFIEVCCAPSNPKTSTIKVTNTSGPMLASLVKSTSLVCHVEVKAGSGLLLSVSPVIEFTNKYRCLAAHDTYRAPECSPS